MEHAAAFRAGSACESPRQTAGSSIAATDDMRSLPAVPLLCAMYTSWRAERLAATRIHRRPTCLVLVGDGCVHAWGTLFHRHTRRMPWGKREDFDATLIFSCHGPDYSAVSISLPYPPAGEAQGLLLRDDTLRAANCAVWSGAPGGQEQPRRQRWAPGPLPSRHRCAKFGGRELPTCRSLQCTRLILKERGGILAAPAAHARSFFTAHTAWRQRKRIA
jgi:hypothetical protein